MPMNTVKKLLKFGMFIYAIFVNLIVVFLVISNINIIPYLKMAGFDYTSKIWLSILIIILGMIHNIVVLLIYRNIVRKLKDKQ